MKLYIAMSSEFGERWIVRGGKLGDGDDIAKMFSVFDYFGDVSS